MLIEKEGKIYHDEHDCEITITNDNTKHIKVVKVKIRSDANPKDVMETAESLYSESLSS